jgi:multidrug efflux system membrane fusion protein
LVGALVVTGWREPLTLTLTPGDTLQDETVVSGGLRAGETVITDGQLRLVPGARVTVKTSLSGSTGTNPPAKP